MRQIESMVRDLDALQHELGRALPSVPELSQAERVTAASALLGFDADLPQRLRETALKFGGLLEISTATQHSELGCGGDSMS